MSQWIIPYKTRNFVISYQLNFSLWYENDFGLTCFIMKINCNPNIYINLVTAANSGFYSFQKWSIFFTRLHTRLFIYLSRILARNNSRIRYTWFFVYFLLILWFNFVLCLEELNFQVSGYFILRVNFFFIN